MTVQELIDELQKVKNKSKMVIYWHFGYREVDKVDDNELAVIKLTMERKIGEVFDINGEWYQCVVENGCENCAFKGRKCYVEGGTDDPIGECCYDRRRDNEDVIFKKLEKIGTTYIENGKLYQKYKVFEPVYDINEDELNTVIAIEIKQEDMEENKLNLKPFDIQKAREGKPVCTRDGRKARIICFDLKNDEYPIVAAVGNDSSETLFSYTTNGEIADGIESDKDLMMLTEKRSGWAKVRKDINLYDTKEEADRKMIGNDEYVTAKICWEE